MFGKRWSNWLYENFDFRYVYLFRLLDTGEEKIGISKNSLRRKGQVENSLNTKIKILHEVKVFRAKKIEKMFQDYFQRKWKPRYSGGGRTEIFQLNFVDVLFLKLWMNWIWLRQRIEIAFYLTVIILLTFLLNQ